MPRLRTAQVTGICSRQLWDDLSKGLYPAALTDMLRYDECTVVEGTWQAKGGIRGNHCNYRWTCQVISNRYGFTPARWASFGIRFVEVD